MQLNTELERAIELARAAGRVILEYYSHPPDVEWKIASEPVTAADKAANALIVEGFSNSFPDDGILAEETPDTSGRLAHDRLWVIDPVDGTKEFIKKNGEFSVMIGLAIDGRAELGVVYKPTEDLLFYGTLDGGAYLTREGGEPVRLHVSEIDDPREMCLAVSRSHRSEKIDSVCKMLGIEREVRSGSVGLKVGLICQRECDLYIHPSSRTKQWDTCAPEALLVAAGGRMTDLAGEPFVYNRRELRNWNGILASNGRAHDRILDQVRSCFRTNE